MSARTPGVTALQLKKYAVPVLGGVAFIFGVNKLTIVWNIDAYWEKCIHWVTIFSAQGNNSFAISIYLCILHSEMTNFLKT